MIIRKSANQNFKKIHNRRKTTLGRTKQGDHRLEVRRGGGMCNGQGASKGDVHMANCEVAKLKVNGT